MRALVASRFDASLQSLAVEELARPVPVPGEVLVEVDCAPVNPADQMMLAGTYIRATRPPFVPGVVGVGRVVGSGGGLMARLLRGRRVVFAATKGKGGSWAEYAVAPAALALPLPTSISDEAGVNLLANAATAVALASELRTGGHRAAVVTGAAGDLSAMLLAECAGGPSLVGVVRGEAQARALADRGWASVVDSAAPDFAAKLKAAIESSGADAALDAVAGAMPEALMEALPDRSTVWVFGRLSGEKVAFDAMRQLIGRGHTLKGFSIDDWFEKRNIVQQLRAVRRATRLLTRSGGTSIRASLTLEEAATSLSEVLSAGGVGKILIRPGSGVSTR